MGFRLHNSDSHATGGNTTVRARRSAHTSNEPIAQIKDCVVPTYFKCFVDIEMACAIQPPSPVARICGRSTSFLALYIAIAAVHPVAAQDTKCLINVSSHHFTSLHTIIIYVQVITSTN